MRNFLLSIAAIAFFTSCESDTGKEYGRLLMTAVHSGDSIRYTRFLYDSQDRLTRMIDSNNVYSDQYITDLFYDQQGRFYKYITTGLGFQQEYFFDFDASNRIIQHTRREPQGDLLCNTYTYDLKGRLIVDSVKLGNGTQDGTRMYTYNNADNIISYKAVWSSDQTITYSDKPNPLYPVSQYVYYIMRQNPPYWEDHHQLFLSKSISSSKVDPGGNKVHYQFQMLSREVIGTMYTSPSVNEGTTVTNFYYEEY